MRRMLISLVFTASAASAEVFKWVDAQGRTQFSDRPEPNAETVNITPQQATDRESPLLSSDDPAQATLLGPYAAFEILSPEANQTLRPADGNLSVSLILDPPLRPEHRLELVLDGSAIAVDKSAATQMQINGATYGSHEAHAQIRDTKGAIIARTNVVRFHLRKPPAPGVIQ